MNGVVDGEGKVVFDAPHFSKYVIVQKGGAEVTVTIEHYDKTANEKIYADDVLKLPIGVKNQRLYESNKLGRYKRYESRKRAQTELKQQRR